MAALLGVIVRFGAIAIRAGASIAAKGGGGGGGGGFGTRGLPMPRVSVKVTTTNRFPEIRRKGIAAVEDAIKAIADDVLEDAKRRAPVETGRLRDSIELVIVGSTAYIRVGAPYAKFVEFGAVHAPAHPFLRPAVRKGEAEDEFSEDFRNQTLGTHRYRRSCAREALRRHA